MTEKTYRISGKIVDVKGRAGIPGLRVEAWDKDLIFDDRIGSAVTDEKGSFLIEFSESYFSDIFLERSPDLFFKIYQNGELAYTTRNSTLWNVRTPELDIVIEIDVSHGEGESEGECNPNELMLRVYGIVRNELGEPLAGTTVKAFDVRDSQGKSHEQLKRSGVFYTPLGETRSDQNGRYQIEFSETAYKNTAAERGGPDLLVRVYDQNGQQIGQSKQVNNAGRMTELNVDINTAPYRVHGTVLDSHGKPVQHVFVQAFDRDLRKLQPLGTVVETEANGGFRIDYKLSDFQLGDPPSRRAPWLVVEIRERPEGNVLASQELQRAEPIQYIEFKLPGEVASEWQRVGEAVEPLLKGQGTSGVEANSHTVESEVQTDLKPFELNAADIEFIMLETEVERAAVEVWVASSRMVRAAVPRLTDEHAAQQATLRDNGWPFFYGIARQGLADDLDAVLRESSTNWQRAWRTARSANRVPVLEEKQLKLLVDVLELLQRLQQLDPVRSGNSDFARVLANTSMPLPTAVALDALSIFHEKCLDDPEALLKLAESHPDAEVPIKTFVRGTRVHQLVSGHVALFSTLNARMEGSTSDSIAPLAALPSSEWMVMANEAAISHGRALLLQAQVEKQHLLTALKARLDAGHMQLPGVSGGEMVALVKEQPATVESILRGSTPVKGHGDETPPATHTVLRDVGRFVRTGVNMELAVHLMNTGIETPAVAIRYGQEHIREQLLDELPKEAADEIAYTFFETVEPVLDGANGFLIDVVGGRALPGWMMEEHGIPLPESVRENLPSLPGLFGDLDECICKPCESMLGQPAYLVDVLNLLSKACPSTIEGESTKIPIDLLRPRRPKILTLPLSCENAETKIQHIDIVLEILEQAAGAEPYRQSANAIYPWGLPFSRAYTETKAYLTKLGVPRLSLLALRDNPEANEMAAETLDLSFAQTGGQVTVSEWQLLTEQRAGAALWAAYGFNIDYDIAIVDPAAGEQLYNQTVQDLLIRASFLIDRTGLDLDELEKVLKTEFVAGFEGGYRLSNRDQCKTSQMRVPAESPVLDECLDRLHRFTRLLRKVPGWSIEQLNKAIASCGGVENGETTPVARENVLVNLAIIKRLHENHGIPLDTLIGQPISVANLRKSLGLSAREFSLLKTITPIDLTFYNFHYPFDWVSLEVFINAAKRIRESGLTINQVAEALLTREHLIALFVELPASIKTNEQIETLLTEIRQHLRSIVVTRQDVTLEAQAAEALTAIFDAVTANKLIQAIHDAGAEVAADRTEHLELLPTLHGDADSRSARQLGEWLPLLPVNEATAILTLSSTLSINSRFEQLLEGIAERRRERALITVIAEQCGLSEGDVGSLLSARLLLDVDGQQPTNADEAFLNAGFWEGENPPSVTAQALPRLHAWMDRLYRLVALSTALKLDSELLHIADRVVVGPRVGIDWREMLASTPLATSAWYNPNWLALLDMLWLKNPEQLSRPVLSKLVDRLASIDQGAVTVVALRPLATRVEIPEAQTLAIAAQAVSTLNALSLRDPTQLRRAFELLLLARHLGADDTQLAQVANPTDNAQAAATAKVLLEARVDEQAWKEVLQKFDDKLRQQRRDALVAYLVHCDPHDKFHNVNDLYEYYLIDPQMEPCLETTRILEAITATQLFAQRILFGIEDGISASDELKQRWTWMRNYRVWEANRKVFLFPENWLYPELRDDKSSSFKQLESALGQGELTQDLARQSFGHFLDDVAQMGQVQVLGMYEDIARRDNGNIQRDENNYPVRRALYVIGRNQNPPYAYFWRQCENFGSPYMEWSPWQRIELDIQGDHVLPFVLGGNLHITWPLISRQQVDTKTDKWEVKLAWSRHDGKCWRKSSVSREFWSAEAEPFSEERLGFAFRCETTLDGSLAKIFVYALEKITGATMTKPLAPEYDDPLPLGKSFLDDTYHPGKATSSSNAKTLLGELIHNNFDNLPNKIQNQLTLYATIKKNWEGHKFPQLDGLIKIDILRGDKRLIFSYPDEAITLYTGWQLVDVQVPTNDEIRDWAYSFVEEFWFDANRNVGGSTIGSLKWNSEYFEGFFNELQGASSCRNVSCKAWIRLKALGDAEDLMVLDGSKGSYSCLIDGNNLAPGRPPIKITKLGEQPAASYQLTLTLNGSPFPSTAAEPLAAVPAGSLANQTLHFEIDGRKLTKEQLGILGTNLDSMRTLSLVSEFRLTRDDAIAKEETQPQPLLNHVGNSKPWMNGYKENSPDQIQPFTISRRGYSDTIVFSPSAPSPFWVVGSATSKSHNILPISWHYSENGVGRYIDLGYTEERLSNSGFFVYPDSYKESTLRRSHWSEFQTLGDPALQNSTFGAEVLPVPAIGTALSDANWANAKTGALAFDARLPYACYNWEVFFHAPLLIADQLSKQHKFEDAEQWLRYVFDPTSGGPGNDAKRFLKFRVFEELDLSKQVIDDLTALVQVAGGFATETDTIAVQKLIGRWRDAPFRPFLIARRRHIAFLWRTLFAYLDNLIAWGDSLYRRDTRESINEATMLYVLAERILGRRPQRHEGSSKRTAFGYEDLAGKWDDFANYWIDVGTRSKARPYMVNDDPNKLHNTVYDNNAKKQPSPDGMLYFCMPFNDKIFSYWNIIEERLFNVRHCRNIEGIERTLALTDAPIDPELLIRAAAAGLDLSDVIAGLYAPPPHYRYNILSARAAELANEARALGAAMLSAIEKRDAEHLAQLRSSNEISLLKLVREVRTLQISETERNLDALRATRMSVSTRYNQYQRLLGKKDIKVPKEQESAGEESMLGSIDSMLVSNRSNLGLIKEENEQYIGFEGANAWSIAAGVSKTIAGVSHAAAAIAVAAAWMDPRDTSYKVLEAGAQGASALGDGFSIASQAWRAYAEQQGMIAGHLRRRDEWAFQNNQTLKELQQIDKQILANKIRIDITRKELNNHIVQTEQAKAVDEVMRSKFSNEQLYEWMKSQLSGLYFNAYRMALEMARRSERAAARDLGVKPLNILRNDYWDSLRDGLLAGERLHQDIKRLEVAYLDQNRREYELTKHISLRRLDPEALVNLRIKDGEGHCKCVFKIPEWLFDLDTPGHYLRRIKSVSVSIPCVVGPYASVNCKLTLLSSQVRHEPTATNYPRGTGEDPRFTDYFGASEAIVTSTGNGDSGLFETQLRDERFLPFEGSGVISTWRLELPGEYPQFDYSTISDVVLSIRYTARDGGDTLREAATGAITDQLTLPSTSTPKPLRFPVVLSCRSDFPTEWARAVTTGSALEIPITRDLLPYWMDAARVNGAKLLIHEVTYAKLEKEQTSPLAFVPANWPVKTNGVPLVNLGEPKVNGNVVADVIVLLSIGK